MADHNVLNNELMYLKGVGPMRAELFAKELGIRNYGQLLFYFPFRYIDRTQFHKIGEIQLNDTAVQLKGKVISAETLGKGRAMRFVAMLQDETGSIELVWFRGVKWLKSKVEIGADFLVYGKPTKFGRKVNILFYSEWMNGEE